LGENTQDFKEQAGRDKRRVAALIKWRRHFNQVSTNQIEAFQATDHALRFITCEATNFRRSRARCVDRIQGIDIKGEVGLFVADNGTYLITHFVDSQTVKLVYVDQ